MSDPLQSDEFPPTSGEGLPNPAVERFLDDAIVRVRRFMVVLGAVATVVTTVVFGWRIGIGVFFGSLLAWANFIWLKQAITGLADSVTQSGQAKSGAGTVVKFFLRYALAGLGAYVIFLSSRPSLYGFLGGLFLTVVAILCEAAYEVFVALRRGI